MKTYPVADRITLKEAKQLGFENIPGRFNKRLRAARTGETRCPKKGEWFLSGAVVEAYRAVNDLDQEYQICRIIRVEEVVQEVVAATL